MQKSTCALAILAAAALAAEAAASGAGGAIFVPARVKQVSHMQAVGGHAPCSDCQRVGFAGVDPASPAPCTAEGGCVPKRTTYGYTATRWRTWPGADYGGQASQPIVDPEAAPDVIDPPAPEDEDRQAPPPIEDAVDPAETVADPIAPAGDAGNDVFIAPPIDLPAVPQPAPLRPAPAAPAEPGDAPPALPFEFGGITPPANTPARVRQAPRKLPVVAPRRDAGVDGPPPLPAGLTRAATPDSIRRLPGSIRRLPGSVRRLPDLEPRRDASVQTVSAELPSE